MFCGHCGKQIDNEAVICPNCGTPTTNSAAANYAASQTAPANTTAVQPVQSSAPASSSSKIVDTFAILGLVLSIVGVLMMTITGLVAILGAVFSIVAFALNKDHAKKALVTAAFVIAMVVIGIMFISDIINYIQYLTIINS